MYLNIGLLARVPTATGLTLNHFTVPFPPLLSSLQLSGTNDQFLQFAQPLVLTFLFSPDVVKILRKFVGSARQLR